MKKILILIILLATVNAYAQDFQLPNIKPIGTSARDFCPKDWLVSDSVRGDLNNDQLDDIVFVIQKKDSVILSKDEIDDKEKVLPKILMIVLSRINGKYFLAEMNSKLLMNDTRPPTYDEPFQSMWID